MWYLLLFDKIISFKDSHEALAKKIITSQSETYRNTWEFLFVSRYL